MEPLAIAALSFVFSAGVTSLAGILLLRWWPALQPERLRGLTPEGSAASIFRWDDRARSWWQRVLDRLGRPARPRDRTRLSNYRQRLLCAGFQNPHAVTYLIGVKVGLMGLCALGYAFYGVAVQRVVPSFLLVSFVSAAAGFFLPDFWLRNRIRARQREIARALPDVLDLLMVCVEAGMGLDAAIVRVAEQPEGRRCPLHQELLRMHLEMRAGRPREEAMRAMAERTGVQEVETVVGAFVQTDRLGSNLGKTLRVHAESARVQRRHRAEERAYLAPLKMLFPTVAFLMPSFFLVGMAPSLLKVAEILRTMSGK